MKIFRFEFTVIITMHSIAFTMLANLEIFRSGNDGWTSGTDTFKLPSSFCDGDESDSASCARLGANVNSESGQNCYCSCPNQNATLMYNNGEWRCLENSLVRDLLGNDEQQYIGFVNENKDSELRMLTISDFKRVTLWWWWFRCHLNEDSSWYIGCNGTEIPFKSSLFAIEKGDNPYRFPYFLKVNRGVSGADFLRGQIIKLGIICTFSNNDFTLHLLFKYEGKLNCSISTSTLQPSVTTRPQNATLALSPTTTTTTTTTTTHLESSTTNRSPSITSRIIPTVSNIPTTVSDAVSYTSPTVTDVRPTVSDTTTTFSVVRPTVSDTLSTIFEVNPTVSNAPPTIPEVRPTTSLTPPTTPDTTTVASFIVPAGPNPGSERRTDSNSSSPALIAGVSASVSAIAVIVGFLVYRRRNSKQNDHSRTKCKEKKETAMTSAHKNFTYEPDDENVYKELDFREQPMYASNYQAPHQSSPNTPDADHVYAPLNISERQNLYGHVNTREPAYSVLEKPTYKNDITCLNYGRSISAEQPTYNLVEEFSVKGAEGPAQDGAYDNQPVYNVLEEPCQEGSEGPGDYGPMSTEEPVYNTLEGPDVERPDKDLEFTNEPIYNVLEEDRYSEV